MLSTKEAKNSQYDKEDRNIAINSVLNRFNRSLVVACSVLLFNWWAVEWKYDNEIKTEEKENYIKVLKKNTHSYIEIDQNWEFIIDWEIYLLKCNNYYTINFNDQIESYLAIDGLSNGIVFKKWENYHISLNFKIEKSLKIDDLKKITKDFVEIDDKKIFFRNWNYYKLKISESYYLESSKSLNLIVENINPNKEVLFKRWDKFYISSWWFEIEEKIDIEVLKRKAKITLYSHDNYHFKDWNCYYIDLEWYECYPIEDWMFLSSYPELSIGKSVLLIKDWKNYLYGKYNEIYLFKENFLDWIKNKDIFMKYLLQDLKIYKNDDFIKILSEIKDLSMKLSNEKKNSEEKILEIYNYMVQNINYDIFTYDHFINKKYSEEYFKENVKSEVYSWIWTYKNKNWVCSWISGLFFYMTSFVWIEDLEIENWIAHNGIDWWKHAWNRIGEEYYDVTWHISSKWTLKFYKYKKEDFFKNRQLDLS
ncbi:MAG: hypothetical protein ACD_4C00143G0005 [uncultured bacterium (gcode 4)]|uniref:Uncharacterized protein n=1 Tax=uncultured bacterium (gcode 4) TaxID=1234023 RepID=K2GTV7_9BACT|nr:MAG: hypothetical protein ACD_4C00143G0005 [uncultured bacterium (gcode 4)]